MAERTPKDAGDVAGGEHDAALWLPPMISALIAQGSGSVAFLDAGIEGVAIDVGDGKRGRVPSCATMRGDPQAQGSGRVPALGTSRETVAAEAGGQSQPPISIVPVGGSAREPGGSASTSDGS